MLVHKNSFTADKQIFLTRWHAIQKHSLVSRSPLFKIKSKSIDPAAIGDINSMIIFGVIKRKPGQNWIQAFLFIFSHLKACAFMWKKVYRNSPAGRCCKLPQIVSSLLQISKIQKKVHFSSIWYWNVLDGCISYLFTKFHDAAVKKSPAATWSKIRCGPKFQHFPPKNESFVSKKKYST